MTEVYLTSDQFNQLMSSLSALIGSTNDLIGALGFLGGLVVGCVSAGCLWLIWFLRGG